MKQKWIKLFVFVASFAVLVTGIFHVQNNNILFAEKHLRVAVVAGFIQPFNEISSDFEKKTGFKIEATFSSAGKLYGQVINGAPYDIVLADEEHVMRLWKEGYAETPFVYA